MPVNTDLVKERLRDLGLMQKDAATTAGISKQYMSDIVNGLRVPTAPVLHRLASTLKVEPGELLAEPSE